MSIFKKSRHSGVFTGHSYCQAFIKGLLWVSQDLEEDPDGDLQTPNH